MRASGDVCIREGLADILLPSFEPSRGPKKREMVFYNSAMELSRDISVAVLNALAGERWKVLDGLGASGVRGIRFALEVSKDIKITINDLSSPAIAYIQKNAELNGVDVTISKKNLNALLGEERFDYIDIDPYGTPVPFLSSALQSLRPSGVLGITATDTAVLFGTKPKTCLRRYHSRIVKVPFYKEVGVRVLLGYIARVAAGYDLAMEPLLSYTTNHYIRVYVRIRKGAKRADTSLTQVQNFEYRAEDMWRELSPSGRYGPLWGGELHDTRLLSKLRTEEHFGAKNRFEKFLLLWKEEVGSSPLFYTVDEFAARLKVPPPRLVTLLQMLKDMGEKASRTHFSPKGFHTTAHPKTIEEAFRCCISSKNAS